MLVYAFSEAAVQIRKWSNCYLRKKWIKLATIQFSIFYYMSELNCNGQSTHTLRSVWIFYILFSPIFQKSFSFLLCCVLCMRSTLHEHKSFDHEQQHLLEPCGTSPPTHLSIDRLTPLHFYDTRAKRLERNNNVFYTVRYKWLLYSSSFHPTPVTFPNQNSPSAFPLQKSLLTTAQ